MRKFVVAATSSFFLATGFGLVALGASAVAQAEPHFVPQYHWCPGDFWDPGWGNNWESGGCHDDHHRDWDAGDHGRDYWPEERRWERERWERDHYYQDNPPPYWQQDNQPPQVRYCIPFVPC
jgi:hypothetical protein